MISDKIFFSYFNTIVYNMKLSINLFLCIMYVTQNHWVIFAYFIQKLSVFLYVLAYWAPVTLAACQLWSIIFWIATRACSLTVGSGSLIISKMLFLIWRFSRVLIWDKLKIFLAKRNIFLHFTKRMESAKFTKIITNNGLILSKDFRSRFVQQVTQFPFFLNYTLFSPFIISLLEKIKIVVFEFSDVFTPESFCMHLTPFKNSASKFLNVLFERTRDF